MDHTCTDVTRIPQGAILEAKAKLHIAYGHTSHGSQRISGMNGLVGFAKGGGKGLYDFADIESFDPDGVYYPFPNDSCEYFASRTGASLGNWAKPWQSSHTVGVDWYSCDSAHSEPLNTNLKAYAAWWLFARLAGWPGTPCQSGTVTSTAMKR